MVSRYGLPCWFAIESALGIAVAVQDPQYLFFDARLYLDATRVWLAGGDPWAVHFAGNYFAAPPPMLLAFAPLTVLPDDIAVALVAVAVVGGGIATIRLLHLPWWWLLFPPLVQCVLSANVQSLIVPMILLPGGGLAVDPQDLRGTPAGDPRPVAVAAARRRGHAGDRPLLPWSTYISEFAVISQRLADQSKLTLPMGFLLLVSPLVVLASWWWAANGRRGSSSRRSGRPSSSTTGRSRCRRGARSRWPSSRCRSPATGSSRSARWHSSPGATATRTPSHIPPAWSRWWSAARADPRSGPPTMTAVPGPSAPDRPVGDVAADTFQARMRRALDRLSTPMLLGWFVLIDVVSIAIWMAHDSFGGNVQTYHAAASMAHRWGPVGVGVRDDIRPTGPHRSAAVTRPIPADGRAARRGGHLGVGRRGACCRARGACSPSSDLVDPVSAAPFRRVLGFDRPDPPGVPRHRSALARRRLQGHLHPGDPCGASVA